jgi:hypothetical protein
MVTSEQVDKIFPALIKAQSEMGNAKKSAVNPFFKSKYADLAEIIEVSKGLLSENGLGVIQSPGGNGSSVTVTCRIIHVSGQWVEDTITLNATKNDPQSIGSAITYARRYQLAALFNIAQEDDDGNDSSGKTDTAKNNTAKQEPQKNIELEKLTVTLEGYVSSGIVSGENAEKANKAIANGNAENIGKWIEWAKKQESGK